MATGSELRAARRAADMSLAQVARMGGLSEGHLSRIERGERVVTPATVALYQRAIMHSRADHLSATVDDVDRRQLLGGMAGAVTAGVVGRHAGAADLDECAQWFAWEAWTSGADIHESALPLDRAATVGQLLAQRYLVRDADGFLRFPLPSLADFYLARRVFTGVATGSSNRLAEAQTSHATDLVLKEFVAADPASAATLGRWMTDGSTAVLRVNAAGILAKVGDPGTTDTVIHTLRSDAPTRDLYLTAVASRVLGLPWDDAGSAVTGAAAPDGGEVALAAELANPRDAAARWCSAVLLHRMDVADREPIRAAVASALRAETARENLRTMAALLAGTTRRNGKREDAR